MTPTKWSHSDGCYYSREISRTPGPWDAEMGRLSYGCRQVFGFLNGVGSMCDSWRVPNIQYKYITKPVQRRGGKEVGPMVQAYANTPSRHHARTRIETRTRMETRTRTDQILQVSAKHDNTKQRDQIVRIDDLLCSICEKNVLYDRNHMTKRS